MRTQRYKALFSELYLDNMHLLPTRLVLFHELFRFENIPGAKIKPDLWTQCTECFNGFNQKKYKTPQKYYKCMMIENDVIRNHKNSVKRKVYHITLLFFVKNSWHQYTSDVQVSKTIYHVLAR